MHLADAFIQSNFQETNIEPQKYLHISLKKWLSSYHN